MRAVVVEPPPPGSPRLARSPLSVGAFDWLDPDPVVTVIVKVTYSFAGDALALAPEQRPLAAANVANLEADLWGELYYPLDFVPHKPQADVIVVGHAHTAGGDPPARPVREIPVRVSVGARGQHYSESAERTSSDKPHSELAERMSSDRDDAEPAERSSLDRAVLARAAAPAESIPLSGSCLFTTDGEHPERVGPARLPATKGIRTLDADADFAAFNAAPPEQRRAYFAPGEPLRLVGLSRRGERALDLPREAPRVCVTLRGVPGDAELAMVADTLWIDTDRELLVLVYRGMLATPRAERVARIAVSLEPMDAARSWPEILRSAARGAIAMSASLDHPESAPRDDDERDRITAARADLVLGELPADPALTLDSFARVSAELAEKREPRADVLARVGLDETAWMVEERAWLEAMARGAQDGDGTLAAEYGEKFVAAQDALAAPDEARRTHADWAETTAALEVASDVSKELTRRELKLSEWMRLDRRVQRAADEDDAVAAELSALLEDARARAEAGARDDEEPDADQPALLAAMDRDDDGGEA